MIAASCLPIAARAVATRSQRDSRVPARARASRTGDWRVTAESPGAPGVTATSRSRRPGGRQLVVDRAVAVELARGRKALGDERSAGPSQTFAQCGVARELRCAALERNWVAIKQSRDAVGDDGAMAVDVGGQHRAAEREGFEHG